MRDLRRWLLPLSGLATFVAVWALAVAVSSTHIVPSPWRVARGLAELAASGALFKHTIASLFRVTWGYLLGVLLGVPTGLLLGWSGRAARTFDPFIQLFRPISPLAWIPIAILWFGVGDPPALFIIFLGSFFPITVASMNAVANVNATHVNVARNFGLSSYQLVRRVLLPAVTPDLVVGMRLTLGIAWLVVVAAEMIAVNSGLGFLIIDSRNAGNRYDLVIAGMVMVGLVGLGLDVVMRRVERFDGLRWSYGAANTADAAEGARP